MRLDGAVATYVTPADHQRTRPGASIQPLAAAAVLSPTNVTACLNAAAACVVYALDTLTHLSNDRSCLENMPAHGPRHQPHARLPRLLLVCECRAALMPQSPRSCCATGACCGGEAPLLRPPKLCASSHHRESKAVLGSGCCCLVAPSSFGIGSHCCFLWQEVAVVHGLCQYTSTELSMPGCILYGHVDMHEYSAIQSMLWRAGGAAGCFCASMRSPSADTHTRGGPHRGRRQ